MNSEYQRPAAEATFAEPLKELETAILLVNGWIHGKPIPRDDSCLANAQLAFIIRALNQFRAIFTLLRTNHWEDGLLLVRSLFELVLNAEELYREEDREAAAARFLKFAHLQDFLEWLELERYAVETGRADIARAAELDGFESSARKVFHEFSFRDKKGRMRWRTTWSNKNVADLCGLSDHPFRMAQYRTIYAKGSAFTHSSPAAVTASMVSGPMEFERFAARSDAVEARGFKLVASFSCIFFLDLMLLVGDRLPAFDAPELSMKITSAIARAVR